jgi:predicted HTH transcriptional regulator
MSVKTERVTRLIREGEGISTEFKRTISSSLRIARILVSFANTSGGTLLIGVEDDGSVTGVSSQLEELEKLEGASRNYITEEMLLSYDVVEVEGRQVMEVTIAESERKPVAVINQKGERTIYIRVKDKAVPTKWLTTLVGGPQELEGIKEIRQVKTLFLYLKNHDHITAKDFSKLVNFSERRATNLLEDLVGRGYLLVRSLSGKQLYSLRIVSTI